MIARTVALPALLLLVGCSDYDVKRQIDPDRDRPEIQVTPQEITFGELAQGESTDEVFTIASVGVQELDLGAFRLTGGGAGAYTITTEHEYATLPAGESVDVVVTYTPTNADDGALVLVESDDPTAPESIVQLIGAGVYPQLSIEPNPVDFGYAEPGDVRVESVDLVNTGGAVLDLDSVVVLGEGFTIDLNAFEPTSLEPGEWTSLDITWSPTIEMVWAGELWVSSNAANATSGSTKATLTGTTIEQPVAVCSVSPEEAFALRDDVTWIGRESYDPSGAEIVSWEWSMRSQPTGSAVGIPSGDADRSGFVADLVGTYVAELVVTNEAGTSSEPCYATLEVVPAQDLWVEMFWTYSGDDMDLHVVGPGGGDLWSQDDCHWQNCVGRRLDWGEAGNSDDDPSLDNDDIPGTGTENINILRPEDATYQVTVHDYPGSVYNAANPTTVKIYLSGELVYEETKSLSGEDVMTPFAIIDWPSRSVSGL
jgi:hypothetical protein